MNDTWISEIERTVEEDTDLITKHAKLVKRIAFHLMHRLPPNVQAEDLIQAGMIGLIEASRQFDPNQGASFESYAETRIRSAMLVEIRRTDWTFTNKPHNSSVASDLLRNIEQGTEQAATNTTVADRLEMPLSAYHRLLFESMSAQIFSFDQSGANNDIRRRTNTPVNFKAALLNAIKPLPERENLVMTLYYDESLSLQEIAECLGVSESKVNQILGQALLRIKAILSDWVDAELTLVDVTSVSINENEMVIRTREGDLARVRNIPYWIEGFHELEDLGSNIRPKAEVLIRRGETSGIIKADYVEYFNNNLNIRFVSKYQDIVAVGIRSLSDGEKGLLNENDDIAILHNRAITNIVRLNFLVIKPVSKDEIITILTDFTETEISLAIKETKLLDGKLYEPRILCVYGESGTVRSFGEQVDLIENQVHVRPGILDLMDPDSGPMGFSISEDMNMVVSFRTEVDIFGVPQL